MQVGQSYKALIEGYDINGYGVCYIENIVVFVEGALKDEIVICELTHVRKRYAFAKLIKILETSKQRNTPACPYFEECGGCDLLHMDYETECKIKENKVKQTLRGKDNIIFNSLIQSDSIYGLSLIHICRCRR